MDVSMFILLSFNDCSSQQQQSTSYGDVGKMLQLLSSGLYHLAQLRHLLDNGMPTHDVKLSIPKFNLDMAIQVGKLLDAMGDGAILSTTAEFSGFIVDIDLTSPTHGDIVHQAKIEVTDEAASAVDPFEFEIERVFNDVVFDANHSFVYLIHDKVTQSVLIAGIYRQPY